MINIKNLLGTIAIFTLLISCEDGQTGDNKQANPETPKALQDNKLDIKSYGRSSNDLIEDIYQELVDETPALKKIEEDINSFTSKQNDFEDKFNLYNSKSITYYDSAKDKVNTITDSLLKMKIEALIAASQKQYSAKTAELNSLLKQISKNGATLKDHHSVLKIILTLPLIQKYQDENKPDKKEFKNLTNEQEKLILRTDSLTPKY